MRLAFYTYSYTDRLDMPIEPCLARIAATGYTAIDVSGTYGKSADPRSFDAARRRRMRQTAEQHELAIEAVVTHAQLTDTLAAPGGTPLDLKGSVQLAVDLGATVVTFHMGGYHEGIDRRREWDRAVAAIRAAAEFGAARHVQLAVDGIWPTWINDSPASLQRLFNDVGNDAFGVNFDPCYLTLMGVDPVVFCQQFASRICHVHLKDHRGRYPEWKHRIPGQGEMQYTRVWRALDDIRFTGAAAVECFTDMPFEEACDTGYAAMTKAAGQAQVTFAD